MDRQQCAVDHAWWRQKVAMWYDVTWHWLVSFELSLAVIFTMHWTFYMATCWCCLQPSCLSWHISCLLIFYTLVVITENKWWWWWLWRVQYSLDDRVWNRCLVAAWDTVETRTLWALVEVNKYVEHVTCLWCRHFRLWRHLVDSSLSGSGTVEQRLPSLYRLTYIADHSTCLIAGFVYIVRWRCNLSGCLLNLHVISNMYILFSPDFGRLAVSWACRQLSSRQVFDKTDY